MNYYKHFFGSYDKHTKSLSILQHGVYRLLMDFYYIKERPLPVDISEIAREIGVKHGPESSALKVVLARFFELKDDGYHNLRCDIDIVKYNESLDKNRENGGKGGRPRKRTVMEKEANGYPENNPVGFEKKPSPLSTLHSPLIRERENAREEFSPEKPEPESRESDPVTRLLRQVESGRRDEVLPNGAIRAKSSNVERGKLSEFFFAHGEERVSQAIAECQNRGWTAQPEQIKRALAGELPKFDAGGRSTKSFRNSKDDLHEKMSNPDYYFQEEVK